MRPLFLVREDEARVARWDLYESARLSVFAQATRPVRMKVLTQAEKEKWDRGEAHDPLNPSSAPSTNHTWTGFVPAGSYYLLLVNLGPGDVHVQYEADVEYARARRPRGLLRRLAGY